MVPETGKGKQASLLQNQPLNRLLCLLVDKYGIHAPLLAGPSTWHGWGMGLSALGVLGIGQWLLWVGKEASCWDGRSGRFALNVSDQIRIWLL